MRAMQATNKVGIARFVMRSKQYVAAIRPRDGHLVLSTMVYADEVVDPVSIGEIEEAGEVDVSERELNMAQQLIESLAAAFDPEQFTDTYREQVLGLIERKAAGEEAIEAPAPAASTPKVVDLLAALEASVREAKAARSRHPATAADAEGEAAEADREAREGGAGGQVVKGGEGAVEGDCEGRREAGRDAQAQVRLTDRVGWRPPVSRSRSTGVSFV